MENIDNVWLTSDIYTKQRLQRIIFPNGLVCENDTFRTILNPDEDTKKGAFIAPVFKMVPESLRCENAIAGNFGANKFKL